MRLKMFRCLHKLCFAAAIFLACYGVARFCHRETAGFRISKITDNCGPDVGFQYRPPTSEERDILRGKFTYFGRGLQSFAFLSEDGIYVLKIFNNRLQKRFFWLNFFGCREKASAAATKLRRTFESYKIAYEDLRVETGILYLHPEPLSIFQDQNSVTTTLIDKLGIEHPLDLNKTGFVLQKRATLAYPWLQSLIEKNDIPAAKAAITALTDLLIDKCRKGIADNDPLIRTNFGFIDNRPIQVDIGPFSKDPNIQEKKVYLPELRRITASLKNWLNHHCPELVQHLETQIKYAENS